MILKMVKIDNEKTMTYFNVCNTSKANGSNNEMCSSKLKRKNHKFVLAVICFNKQEFAQVKKKKKFHTAGTYSRSW